MNSSINIQYMKYVVEDTDLYFVYKNNSNSNKKKCRNVQFIEKRGCDFGF